MKNVEKFLEENLERLKQILMRGQVDLAKQTQEFSNSFSFLETILARKPENAPILDILSAFKEQHIQTLSIAKHAKTIQELLGNSPDYEKLVKKISAVLADESVWKGKISETELKKALEFLSKDFASRMDELAKTNQKVMDSVQQSLDKMIKDLRVQDLEYFKSERVQSFIKAREAIKRVDKSFTQMSAGLRNTILKKIFMMFIFLLLQIALLCLIEHETGFVSKYLNTVMLVVKEITQEIFDLLKNFKLSHIPKIMLKFLKLIFAPVVAAYRTIFQGSSTEEIFQNLKYMIGLVASAFCIHLCVAGILGGFKDLILSI